MIPSPAETAPAFSVRSGNKPEKKRHSAQGCLFFPLPVPFKNKYMKKYC